ncbi:transglutaminase-like enzyme, predicted cysteine protease [Cylindrospermum stagnale PCC 7417]|uniref:Transglutaminase-like enzyme, predicted cysteine protease n=2 Tax=Cylindrospermum stagnale TaxID=142864 RepID=K9X380_9NOST|nr:transglutaminase-like enzyme, predicted cysteine protease [Cylindrospermum stagnale PCC 7417]
MAEVEDSIALRVLVLALVILGIVATDIAADTRFSLWAVPSSMVGAIWANYSRQNPNIPVKFCIAIGMLVALGALFGRLLGELNDTRLSLAELLIQLQVLHSFDTPRRKDLGYSIVIGLILLGVAATLSQTLSFAPVLLLFLAIALPTLVLDYRSRLGLKQLSFKKEKFNKQNSSSLNFKFLIQSFLLILGLGLLIFAVMPRFPGYQLRTFPVSSPINVKGSFTGRSIINPGYVRQGNGNNQGNVTGKGRNGQPGKVDDSFYYGFNSQMNQNLRGEMKPKVVMRVRSQAEGFWRVLAFDKYTGKGWEISRNEEVTTFRRSPWSYQIFLTPQAITGKTKEIIQTYTVVADLPNLIPAMADPKEIYFPTPVIAVDKENGLRSPVELSENLTYTVVSAVPYRDRTALGKAATKYPSHIQKYYLNIPPEIAEKVRQRTEKILADYNQERVSRSLDNKSLDSPYEKALYLAQYLKQNYSIPENPFGLPYLDEKEDLVAAFLFKNKGGYPDHFSTVLTVMLRSIGIPARLVAGFAPGEFNPFTGMYIVRNTDAYAMTEVYFPKHGWFTFDPIPNHPLIPPSIEETQTFSVLRSFWHWVAGWLPSPVTGLLNNVFGAIFSWITSAIAWFLALFSQGWLGILTGLILATTASFFCWLFWVQWLSWLNRRWLHKLPPMESLYQQMLQWTAKKGLGKHPAQTPLEYGRVSYQHHSPATAQVIDEICQAYVSWRYGGDTPNWKQLRQKWQELKQRKSDRPH